jgi:hypothetical protein
MFNETQKDAFRLQGYSVRGNSIFRTLEDLSPTNYASKSEFLNRVQSLIHVYPGFDIRLRVIEGLPFIQIQPKSVLEFSEDIHSLLSRGTLTIDEILNQFEEVQLPIDRVAHLRAFSSKKARDPLSEPPFNGLSFLEYARANYRRLSFEAGDADVLIVVPRMSRSPWYFTSEHVRPSVSFYSMSRFDPQYVGAITSAMKVYSAKRASVLETLQSTLQFKFFDLGIRINDPLSYEGLDFELPPDQFLKEAESAHPFFRFPRPWARFVGSDGNPVDVNDEPYLGAPGDLLKHPHFAPFDVPKPPGEIVVKVICDHDLEEDARTLVRILQTGFGKYRGFQKIFRCPLRVESFTVTKDFKDSQNYSDISSSRQDCVLVIGPRSFAHDSEKAKSIYTHAETSILNKGVPPQFVANDPSSNPIYDASLKTKASNSHALFGLGLNVLGKIGAKVLDLSPKSCDFFIPNSVVLAYNIARIFEPVKRDTLRGDSTREAVKASIALSAPIVVMTDHGTEIINQYVHKLSGESTLFSSEHGLQTIGDIPSRYSRIIIHKDGLFSHEELLDIDKLQAEDRIIIPVSIVSGSNPRIRTSIVKASFLPKPGLVFKLSENDFLMSTTLVTSSYVPEERGWPNPIWIHIHDEVLAQKLTKIEKLKILYQIWCFTRLHLGSEIPTRKPISIHYSNQMTEFLRKSGDSKPAYFRLFGGRKNRLGYIPRPFM